MADDNERLSTTAAKAKRNLLFFAVLAWALACGWVEPSEGGRVELGGIGAQTSIRVILWGLVALLAYNLVSFLLHGPFGREGKSEWVSCMLDPENGLSTYPDALFDHITRIAGLAALPASAKTPKNLELWMSLSLDATGGRPWGAEENKGAGLMNLWNALSENARRRLVWRGVAYRRARLALVEGLWDMWLPLAIGLSGLVALGWALWRLC